ncbi:unnamed protein product [Pieris macdunnoughi]|uniref:Uncharacterized protein n=1 Tax=Pieris macdunnoughi TaxID=345717 RepID=A0A821QAA6_9NEOP|nr:unnamed protein product [Pieris macdunnoughi]
MQLQFALSSRRSSSLAPLIAFPRHITRLVISYQAPRHIEKDPDAKGAAKPAFPTVTGGLRTHPTKSRPCSSNSTKNQFFPRL